MNVKRTRVTLSLLTALICATGLDASPTKSEIDSHKKIVGYFPEWGVYSAHNSYAPSDTPFNKLTHINYAFARIINGEIAIFDDWAATGITFGESWDSEYKGNLGQFKKLKKQYPDTSVLISVGGWTQSANFHEAALTQAARLKFAASCVAFVRQWDFDGVDIDWEFPTQVRQPDPVDNAGDTGTPRADANEKLTFTLLLKTLREELDKAGAEDGRYYQLTAAVGASVTTINNVETDKYHEYLDFVNIMTYDMHGAWESKTGHQSPLYTNPNIEDPFKLTINNAVKLMKEKGVPSSKIIIGSPYYSRGWKGVKNDGNMAELPGLNASATGGANGIWDGGRAAGVNPFYHIKENMENNGDFVKYRDEYTKMPYLYSESKGEMYTYEDEESIAVKAEYVNDNSLGGVIFWEVSADYPSKGSALTTVLFNRLLDGNHPTYAHDNTTPTTSSSSSQQTSSASSESSSSVGETTPPIEGVPTWNAREVYFAETLSQHKGQVYKASWWTMGNEPGAEQWGPWKIQSSIEGSSSSSSVDVVESSSSEATSSQPTVGASSSSVGTQQSSSSESSSSSEPTTASSSYDSSKVYILGDRVLYNGILYEASWWTRGDTPGSAQWGPWKVIEDDTSTNKPSILNVKPSMQVFVPVEKQSYYQEELSEVLIEFKAEDSDGQIKVATTTIGATKHTMKHIGGNIYRIKWMPKEFGLYTLSLETQDNDAASVINTVEIEIIKK